MYDYIYDETSQKRSEELLQIKTEQSIKKAFSDACNYLHKLHVLNETGEKNKWKILRAEAICKKLEKLIDACKI